MPVPGAMGAIAASSRRRRQGTGYKPSVSKQSSFNSESAQSVLTRFKQQAQETGVFLKKQQQAFSQQVQKGIKMASSLKPSQKKDHASHQTEEIDIPTNHITGDERFCMREPDQATFHQMAEWSSALAQMGFERAHICGAARILGGQPEHFDDLLQAVVAFAASEEKASSGGASSSSMSLHSGIYDKRPSESEPFLPTSSKGETTQLQPQPPLPPPASPPPLSCTPACESTTFLNADDKTTFLNSAPLDADDCILDALSQMGFEVEAIHAASQMLGEEATVDDFSDLLLRMPDIMQSTKQAPLDTSAGSVEVLYDGNDYESEEDQQSSSVPEVKLIEPSSKELAAVIVASAVAKAAQNVPETKIETKQIGDQPSPVRGGA